MDVGLPPSQRTSWSHIPFYPAILGGRGGIPTHIHTLAYSGQMRPSDGGGLMLYFLSIVSDVFRLTMTEPEK